MTISIWRYSHLTLAISSFMFILLATLTGVILALEPISNRLKPYAVKNTDDLLLSQTIEKLKTTYDEVLSIDIDKNDFVIVSVVTKEGRSETFYINPFTSKKIGDIIEKAPVFKFATNLHRSLFLKSTGRAIVGFVSFLLFLMSITGLLLIVKRQGGVKRFFSKVLRENFEQYYHIIIGRYSLIPLIIITLTGVFLSLEKFSLIPSDKNIHISNFKREELFLFKSLLLSDVVRVEFPFSNAVEDYFVIKLKDKELYVNQFNGHVISEKKDSFVTFISRWSMLLHTGQASMLWSVILLLTCFSLLFFIYSGFAISLKRKKKSIKITNEFNKDTAEYIILIGSETGSTVTFAGVLHDALLAEGCSVYTSELNSYTSYKKAKHLVLLTSTYGDGESPSNAKYFSKLVHSTSLSNRLQYAVVGFGSLAYKDYCKYAILVDDLLQKNQNFTQNLKLHKIHNQSFVEFEIWVNNWNESTGLNLVVKNPIQILNHKKTTLFKLVKRSDINLDNSFLLELEPVKKTLFFSGDLLSITPNSDHVERLYSIGKVNNKMLLSIKKHEFGVCSKYFSELKINDMVLAMVKSNKKFHFPKSAKDVIMIANGTGIGPFLGMINDENTNKTKIHLFWGGRTQASFQMYSKQIDIAIRARKLIGIYLSFSREGNKKKYVQKDLEENKDLIAEVIKNNGVIMICGSMAMQKGVLETLDSISRIKLGTPLNLKQIKTDCY
ncbi:MAG: FAD-binding oxidoreductase [Flavobacteriaceae bacterium]|nr:MAG: FAD-binding oxidoreductase [Flavobacteriaceae bacterium]